MAQHKYSIMDVEDYLLLNRSSKNIRYEYLDGEIRMLAGGSPDHSIIIANLTATIKGPAEGQSMPRLQFRRSTTALRKTLRLPRYHGELRRARPEPERNDTLPPPGCRGTLSNHRIYRQGEKSNILPSVPDNTRVHDG